MGLLDLPRFYHTSPNLSSISFWLSVLVHSNRSGATIPMCVPALFADPVQIAQSMPGLSVRYARIKILKSSIRNNYRFRCPFRLFDCTWIIAHRFGICQALFSTFCVDFLKWSRVVRPGSFRFGVFDFLGAANRFILSAVRFRCAVWAVRFDCLDYSTVCLVCQSQNDRILFRCVLRCVE